VIRVEMTRLSADMNSATIMRNAIIQDAEPSRRAEIVRRRADRYHKAVFRSPEEGGNAHGDSHLGKRRWGANGNFIVW